MPGISHYYVIKHFDLYQLARPNQIACHFDVSLRWRRVARYAANGISGVIPHPVLCRMACDLPWFSAVNLWLDAA